MIIKRAVCAAFATSLLALSPAFAQARNNDALKDTTSAVAGVFIPQPGPVNFTKPPTSKSEQTEKTAAIQKQMKALVKNNWSAWTGSNNESLTMEEIGTLLSNPRVTFAEAAFLSQIANILDNANGQFTKLSLAQIQQLIDGGPIMIEYMKNGKMQVVKLGNLSHLYLNAFENLNTNLSNGNYSLWGDDNKPSVPNLQAGASELTAHDIHQGDLADCWWLSAVEAIVISNPSFVENMIQQPGLTTYRVKFPNQAAIDVALTHGYVAQLNRDPGDGVWLAVLTVAMGRLRNSGLFTYKGNLPSTGIYDDTPGGEISQADGQVTALMALTGHEYLPVLTKHGADMFHHKVMDSVRYEEDSSQLDKDIQDALKAGDPICLRSNRHGLAIVGYNNGIYTILNPWGTTEYYDPLTDIEEPEEEAQEQSSTVGFPMANGEFTCTIDEIENKFVSVRLPKKIFALDTVAATGK